MSFVSFINACFLNDFLVVSPTREACLQFWSWFFHTFDLTSFVCQNCLNSFTNTWLQLL
jgi:hypothetical protein